MRRGHEESILLVEAASRAEAFEKARRFAASHCTSYENAEGRRVTWSVVDVIGAYELLDRQLTDGVEVHSRMFRNVGAYRRLIDSVGGE